MTINLAIALIMAISFIVFIGILLEKRIGILKSQNKELARENTRLWQEISKYAVKRITDCKYCMPNNQCGVKYQTLPCTGKCDDYEYGAKWRIL